MGTTRSYRVGLQRPASVSDVIKAFFGPRMFIIQLPLATSSNQKTTNPTLHILMLQPRNTAPADHGRHAMLTRWYVWICYKHDPDNEIFFQPITDILLDACDELGAKRIPYEISFAKRRGADTDLESVTSTQQRDRSVHPRSLPSLTKENVCCSSSI